MVENVVRSEARGHEIRITICRPDQRNALNRDVAEGIVAALQVAEADADCRVIVVTGEGERAFCAGGDLKAGADGGPFVQDPADPGHFAGRLFEALHACRKPTIARINGVAVGGGAGIICACDLAVMADHAKIGTPEVKVGLFPMTIVPPMMRVLPRRRLMEMFITGIPLTAEESLRHDLVNYVTDSAGLDDKVSELVAQIAAQSPTAIRLGKYACHAMDDMTYPQQMRFAETLLPRMAQTEDAREGFDAFTAKRKPEWTGR
ncbi:enoyl-CoA hydratase [Salipiger aestuarii]|jgi:enoyl-CoA hydratase/carnithine racemase|uniref:Enoyl-CoA hydratase/carnithine racemase n=2 Tax=Salipiger TaxID=263377 RepID=A0A1G7JH77_9RHOB|nr:MULTISPECIES: enoyl-CoA hydratase-related protein [Roseobacteraceae]KAB2540698.1 enoyl-CoA hydratase [Salipiger aestuarii]RAK17122.1 enoyl-CoA hydratase/carnithine racemase [Salipiger aestuarii]WHZ38468.1 enoyl-CoA hydratase-related protein [Sagittula sp. MA-2]SDF24268.1 Enoyl-CoA hydratase/carnithine racemase [Salipiger thiooxidans]